jgi:hypothetical protein
MNIFLIIFYLLQRQKLNPNKYSDHELNMRNFIKATDNYGHMYAKSGDLNFYEFL